MNAPYVLHTPQISLVDRDLRWLEHIVRHGPQSSEFLFEATRSTHRCKDTALRRLQTLREARLLRLPPQQKHIAKAEFNPYVYDVTGEGVAALKDADRWQNDVRPTGHWWHGFWVASVTSAIEIDANRGGDSYIPARVILDRSGASLGVSTRLGTLVPDQLFAIRSKDGYRAYMLEVDRGTEPITSRANRKSLQKSLEQYGEVLSAGRAKQHFRLNAPVVAAWVMSSRRKQRSLEDLIGPLGAVSQGFAVLSVRGGFPKFEEVACRVSELH